MKNHQKRVLIPIFGVHSLLFAYCTAKALYGDPIIDVIAVPIFDKSIPSINYLSKSITLVDKLFFMKINKLIKLENLANKFARAPIIKSIINLIISFKIILITKQKKYDAIIYAHDIINSFIPMLKMLYPDSNLVSYGDGAGSFYSRQTFTKIQGYNYTERPFYKEHKPDIACALLPIEINPDFLGCATVLPVKKEIFFEAFDEIKKNLKGYNEYVNNILDKYKDVEKSILLTENWNEGNGLDFEKEIELYKYYLEKNIPKNSLVFIKSHPLENRSRIKSLQALVQDDYKLVEIDERFNFLPIELFSEIINNCKHIICAGVPIITLKHLYNKDVIDPHVLQCKFFEEFLPEKEKEMADRVSKLYNNILEEMQNWNGSGILYSGNY